MPPKIKYATSITYCLAPDGDSAMKVVRVAKQFSDGSLKEDGEAVRTPFRPVDPPQLVRLTYTYGAPGEDGKGPELESITERYSTGDVVHNRRANILGWTDLVGRFRLPDGLQVAALVQDGTIYKVDWSKVEVTPYSDPESDERHEDLDRR